MISILFNILFILVPVIFFKNTSELFEFNKIITLYTFTVLIITTWLIKSIRLKKFIFRRTILDWPLLIFIFILLLSSVFSIDPRTSLFGYYSRFNGGILSSICYPLLYWAYVSNMDNVTAKKSLVYLIFSTLIASFFAILEHFNFSLTCGLMGFNFTNSCWVQDVQNRVYSTFGQPNWLAAFVIALIPIVFGFTLVKTKNINKKNKLYLYYLVLGVFFITLLFTKSRSGILGFLFTDLIFSGLVFFKYKKEYLKKLIIVNLSFLALILTIGTPWNQPIFNNFTQNEPKIEEYQTSPALETGGTESGVIRQIVWKGAYQIWKSYPILGTGPETFAFSYPRFKPIEHNLTSEWDFIYNKAHNEYLNYLATTGILGLISYLTLVGVIFLQLFKSKNILSFSLLAGFVGILITNFFGFSVVTTSLLFFIIPAISVTQNVDIKSMEKKKKTKSLKSLSKIFIFLILILSTYLLIRIYRYWQADTFYNKAKLFSRSDNPIAAREEITKAIKISPKEALYWSELSTYDADIAVLLSENNEYEKALEFANYAIDELKNSISLSENNVNLKKTSAGVYLKLTVFDSDHLTNAEDLIKSAIKISPNDPKLYYQLGLINIKLDKFNDGISFLEKSITLKPNYKDARFALGSIYKNAGEIEKANENFKYILEKIDPNDELTKKMYN